MQTCAFCMRSAKLSGEHLWSQWIGELFAGKFAFYKQVIGDSGDSKVVRWNSTTLSATAKVVCESCNNTWMSDLESKHAKPAMQKMLLTANPVILTKHEIASLAIFAFKSAVIGDHMQRDKVPFFSADVRRRFAHSLAVPRSVYVWLGCVGRVDPHHGMVRIRYKKTPTGATNGFHLYIFTWGVGRFVLQLVAFRWTKGRLRKTIVPDLTQDNVWDDFAIPVWPSDGSSVEWPPLAHLSHNFLDEFTDRWDRITLPGFPL